MIEKAVFIVFCYLNKSLMLFPSSEPSGSSEIVKDVNIISSADIFTIFATGSPYIFFIISYTPFTSVEVDASVRIYSELQGLCGAVYLYICAVLKRPACYLHVVLSGCEIVESVAQEIICIEFFGIE